MDTPTQQPTLDESIALVVKTLPPLIRDYLAQEKYTPVTRSLMTTYRLHTDQGGILEREIMLMLAGVDSPAEFAQALAEEAKLDARTVNGIMQDVNAQIFLPLREEMRSAGKSTPQVAQKVAPPAPRPASMPIPNYSAPPLQSPRYTHLDNKVNIDTAPLPPKMAMPSQTAPRQMATPPTAPRPQTIAITPHLEALPVGEKEPEKVSVIPAPTPTPTPPLVPPTPAPPTPVRAPSTSDPYREPIDGQ